MQRRFLVMSEQSRRPQTRASIAVSSAATFLLAHPILLVPILLLAAMVVLAVLKKLLKIAAVLLIAGALYVLLVRYFGG